MKYGHMNVIVDDILTEIINAVDQKCVSHSGNTFVFTYSPVCISLRFSEYYFQEKHLFSKWRKDKPSIEDQSSETLSKVKSAISDLPSGILAELVIKEIIDERETAQKTDIRVCKTVTYAIEISVSSEYAKRTYEKLSVGCLIHDSSVSAEFLQLAYQFCKRIQRDRIHKIKQIIESMYNYDYTMRHWNIQKEGIFFDEYIIIKFSDYGLAPLASWEQAYGLACCLSENICVQYNLMHTKYKLEKTDYFISAIMILPQKEPLPLEPW